MGKGQAYLLMLILGTALVINAARGSKILFLCDESPSHQALFTALANEMTKRGHTVFWLLPENMVPEGFSGPSMHPVFYSTSGFTRSPQDDYDEITQMAFRGSHDQHKLSEKISHIARILLMESNEAISTLEEASLDLAVVDGIYLTKFKYMIPHRLGIPTVTLSHNFEPWSARVPWLPSFVPLNFVAMSDKMTFIERVQNLFLYFILHVRHQAPELPKDISEAYSEYGEFSSLDDLMQRTQLWVVTSDSVLDYSKPRMPNMVEAGGLSTKPPHPLSPYWKEIVENSPDGVVVVSLGSITATLPKTTIEKLLSALGKLEQTVIWQIENTHGLYIPQNVIIADWIPQNDLLANPYIDLLVTHCGSNSQFEALYHGVPMVGLPAFGDQFYNAKRIAHKGFGLHLDLDTSDPLDLLSAMEKVINNPIYMERISKASLIFHDQPETPAGRAVTAIEHVLQYGGDHLKSVAADMPMYQFLMLDIMALLGCGLMVATFLAKWLICVLWGVCCHQPTVQPKLKDQ